MDVLCTDKTGTITEDRVVLVQHLNPFGKEDQQVLDMTYLNSYYQTGWKNLMDIAVLNYFEDTERQAPYQEVIKVDEIPLTFPPAFNSGCQSRWTPNHGHKRCC